MVLSVVALYPVAQAAPIVPAAPDRECADTETSCEPPKTTTATPRPPALPQQSSPSTMIPQQRPTGPNANPPAGALVPPTPGAGRGAPIVPVG